MQSWGDVANSGADRTEKDLDGERCMGKEKWEDTNLHLSDRQMERVITITITDGFPPGTKTYA